MQSVLVRVLLSNRLTTVLLLLFAMAMAFGTFLENDFGTQAVQTTVYRSWWFELIMFLLGVNFVGNIFKYRLYRKEKLPILTFHIAFIVTLIGAFITRYISFEGIMHIREGSATNEIVSQDRYIRVSYKENGEEKTVEKKLALSYFTQPDFSFDIGADDQVTIKGTVFVPDAEQKVVQEPGGQTILTIVTSSSIGRENLYLQSGGSVIANNRPITLNNPRTDAINIIEEEGRLKIISPIELSYMVMASQTAGTLTADTLANLQLRVLYRGEDVSFVIPEVYYDSKVVYVPTEDKEKAKRLGDMLFIDIISEEGTTETALRAADGNLSSPRHVDVGGMHLDLTYGPKPIVLPFSLALRDFQLERYPGSVSPSSYASEVTVIDGDQEFPYRIYMNNVLDYQGYRFFQASYDTDELGTVLSVNKDFWGTLITYIGYTLMGLGMMLTLFGKQSRFQFINRRLSKLNKEAVVTALAMFILLGPAKAQDSFTYPDNVKNQVVSSGHAAEFGKLLVQDLDGRIKPLNTLSSEFLRKVHGRSTFKANDDLKLNSDQLFLMVNSNPLVWQSVPIIKIDAKKTAPILQLLNKDSETNYLEFTDLIDASGNYLLQDQVLEASRKKPAERSSLDDELIKVDERFNVFFQGLTGHFLKIFPLENDPANTWFNDKIPPGSFNTEDSAFVVNVLPVYYGSVLAATKSGDWAEADETLGYLKTFQSVKGEAVIPLAGIQQAEVLYNKLKLFNHLFGYFWIFGLLLLVAAILRIFYTSKYLIIGYWLLTFLISLGFLALTFNLVLRWYAAQYPPWSNGYEMIILVAWSILLFGFIFIRKSRFVVALGALFTGTLLFVAFLDWLNPEITNLVPVLKSYWLKIHVAIIVGSYAPLALSALLGLLALLLMIADKGDNNSLKRSIKELTYINEMSMTIGLFMLAIGTFLGGVWANESWGRYWGWDPKETWALISVIIYAAVLHLRLIPKLNDIYVFNVASVWAFFSIIMTSFGVNYYLAGLHSYAKGDPVPIPQFIYWVVAILLAISILANIAYRRSRLSVQE